VYGGLDPTHHVCVRAIRVMIYTIQYIDTNGQSENGRCDQPESLFTIDIHASPDEIRSQKRQYFLCLYHRLGMGRKKMSALESV
jgi:hypothetical protein